MRARIIFEYDLDDDDNWKLQYIHTNLWNMHEKGVVAMRKAQQLIRDQEGEYSEIC